MAGMSARTPGQPLARSAKTLVEEASAKVSSLTPQLVAELADDPGHLVVDIRDPRELEREGSVPGAFRAPRGMLEFWVDPESPYYKPALDDGRTLILFCGGAWRSALAAATLKGVRGLEGGWPPDRGDPVALTEACHADRGT